MLDREFGVPEGEVRKTSDKASILSDSAMRRISILRGLLARLAQLRLRRPVPQADRRFGGLFQRAQIVAERQKADHTG